VSARTSHGKEASSLRLLYGVSRTQEVRAIEYKLRQKSLSAEMHSIAALAFTKEDSISIYRLITSSNVLVLSTI